MSNLLTRAGNFAIRAHEGQVRKHSGLPYISHPFEVTRLVQVHWPYAWCNSTKYDLQLAQAWALLHDVVEDCDVTIEEIKLAFGSSVQYGVFGLTKQATEGNKLERNREDMRRIVEFNDVVQYVKCCDILANVTDFRREDPKYLDNKYGAIKFEWLQAMDVYNKPFAHVGFHIANVLHPVYPTDANYAYFDMIAAKAPCFHG
jgi:(p)ppGpp synthase/HD superfamily hydrolase